MRGSIAGRLALLFAACAALSIPLGRTTAEEQPPWTLAEAMRAAAGYLEAHLDADGRFDYLVHSEGGEVDESDYNVVRHAGAVYGLWTHHDLARDERVAATMCRAARYLLKRYVRPVQGVDGADAVFSLPGEEVDEKRRVAKLGGTALGLVALAKARGVDPEAVPLQTLRRLGVFILFMQRPSGRFDSKYREASGIDPTLESLYYPGEAILALTCLYEADPDPRWLDAALRGIAWLVASRRHVERLPNDHWLMIAAAHVLPHHGRSAKPPLSRAAIVEHVLALGRGMLAEQARASRTAGLDGSFHPDGRITPAATRLEGLTALHGLLPELHPARADLRRSIEAGVAFIRRGQLRTGPHRGGFLRAVRRLRGREAFNRRQPVVRIDYVQHALSAMAGYHRILQSERR